jgi:hypothetical protein
MLGHAFGNRFSRLMNTHDDITGTDLMDGKISDLMQKMAKIMFLHELHTDLMECCQALFEVWWVIFWINHNRDFNRLKNQGQLSRILFKDICAFLMRYSQIHINHTTSTIGKR